MVKGKRARYDIYIGRRLTYPKATFPQSKWANPFPIKKFGRIKGNLKLYEKHIRNSPDLWNALHELKDKILGCWCKPEPCHGDIIIKLLKESE